MISTSSASVAVAAALVLSASRASVVLADPNRRRFGLSITEALVDFDNERLHIAGRGLDAGPSLSVKLGELGFITNYCVADLICDPQPIDCDLSTGRLAEGDYLTIGAVGPEGPQEERPSCKAKRDRTNYREKQGHKGRQALIQQRTRTRDVKTGLPQGTWDVFTRLLFTDAPVALPRSIKAALGVHPGSLWRAPSSCRSQRPLCAATFRIARRGGRGDLAIARVRSEPTRGMRRIRVRNHHKAIRGLATISPHETRCGCISHASGLFARCRARPNAGRHTRDRSWPLTKPYTGCAISPSGCC